MTPEQAFKVGFLYKCAEDGLSMRETHARVKKALAEFKAGGNLAGLEKAAILPALAAGAGTIAGGTAGLAARALTYAPSLLSTGAILGAAAPIALGAGGGYAAAKLTQDDKSDALENAKQDELLGEYERLTEAAKRRALLKRIQAQTGRRIVPMSPSLGI